MRLRPAAALGFVALCLCAATCPSAPTAVLTAPATVELGAGFTLDGTGSTGDGLRAYRWTNLDADGLDNLPRGTEVVTTEPTLAVTLAAGTTLAPGRSVFSLVVEDSKGQRSSPSLAVVEVRHSQRPTAVVRGPDLASGTTLVLNGESSFAMSPAKLVEYRWTNTAFSGGLSPFAVGQTIATRAPTLTLAITGHPMGRGEFQLEVVDDWGLVSQPDFLTVRFAPPGAPTAVITAPTAVELGAPFTLLATQSFAAAGVRLATYTFTSLTADAGTLGVNQPVTTTEPQVTIDHAPSVPGRYEFQLEVTDELGVRSAPEMVAVVVRDGQRPTAVIDGPANVSLAQPFELSGARSFDVGGTVTQWTFGNLDCGRVAGWPTNTVRTQSTPSLAVQPLDGGYDAGVCTFVLTVTDDSGNQSQQDTVRLMVADRERPTAVVNVPTHFSIIRPITLDGSPSFDLGGGHVAQWVYSNNECQQLAGWAPGTSIIQTVPTRTVPVPDGGLFAPEVCTVGLSVVDDWGNASLPTTVRVALVDDVAPTASLQGPSNVSAGGVINLSGAKSFDIGGRIVSYAFTNVSLGGVEATFPIGSTQVTTSPTLSIGAPKGGFVTGTARLRLTVTDDSGNPSTADELAILIGN